MQPTRSVVPAALVLALAVSGCAREPKDSYVDRVRTVCGPEVARGYAGTKWRDRDYAHDALLTSCLAFRVLSQTNGARSHSGAVIVPRSGGSGGPARGSRGGPARAKGGR